MLMPYGHRLAPTEPAGETFEPMTPCVSDRYSEPTELSSCKWKEKGARCPVDTMLVRRPSRRRDLEPPTHGASTHRSTIGAIFPKEKPPAFIRQVVLNKELLLAAHILSNPHDLIKTSQIIQFLLMHQN